MLWLDWGDRRSAYHPGWLRAFCYDLGARDPGRPSIETWDGSFASRLPTFEADAVATDPGTRLCWLEAIQRYGIALVTGSPTEADAYAAWLEGLLLIRI